MGDNHAAQSEAGVPALIHLDPLTFRYTAAFCEENIWWLAHDLVEAGRDVADLWVLLFTNPADRTLMFNQQVAAPGRPNLWDYHVVLLAGMAEQGWVLDLDTRLGFVTPAQDYFRHSFAPQLQLPEQYRCWVRRIPATAYLRRFHSDRSHMLGRKPPDEFPDYPIINPGAGIEPIDLSQYRDVFAQLDDGSQVKLLSDWMPALA